MSVLKWLKQDSLILGIILGTIIPVPFALLFASLLRLIQYNLHFLGRVRDADILLLGIAINLVVMRFYFVKFKFENTGKGILILTVIMILLFFFFLKSSNFAFPF
jgi:hypothetical protein